MGNKLKFVNGILTNSIETTGSHTPRIYTFTNGFLTNSIPTSGSITVNSLSFINGLLCGVVSGSGGGISGSSGSTSGSGGIVGEGILTFYLYQGNTIHDYFPFPLVGIYAGVYQLNGLFELQQVYPEGGYGSNPTQDNFYFQIKFPSGLGNGNLYYDIEFVDGVSVWDDPTDKYGFYMEQSFSYDTQYTVEGITLYGSGGTIDPTSGSFSSAGQRHGVYEVNVWNPGTTNLTRWLALSFICKYRNSDCHIKIHGIYWNPTVGSDVLIWP